MKLGFSTGTLYKSHSTFEALKTLKDLGHDVIELKLELTEKDGTGSISEEDLAGFRYLSIHAPAFNYGGNGETQVLFKRIERINSMRKLDTVVFHPDLIQDFSVFKDVNFNVAFENMDNRKKSHQRPEELDAILCLNDKYRMVLDVNHINCNDVSMELAKVFYEKLGDKITEIHLSGYKGYNGSHEPLFETKQVEIIKAIQNFNTPIIIEGVVSLEDLKKEQDYILTYM